MNVEDFTYDLPEELIADQPAARRDESRLLVVQGAAAGTFLHRRFHEIGEYLRPGDLLVMNDSRVLPARLYGRRPTGGRVEFLLLHREGDHPPVWRALTRPARKLTRGDVVEIAPGELSARILEDLQDGEKRIEFICAGDFRALLEKHGEMPLPPYILKRREALAQAAPPIDHRVDRERYQTVYARAEGSVAAPTAGLHFTRELLDGLLAVGIQETCVTLHVGAGTFQSMKEGGRVEEHRMHFEECEVGEETAGAVNRAKAEGRRVIAVGTTSVRTLESAWDRKEGRLVAGRRSTDLMISPGYRFGVVDGLVTNFHLPRSTLLLLVSALMGRDRMLAAYAEAIRERYRFFSYGDAMLLIP